MIFDEINQSNLAARAHEFLNKMDDVAREQSRPFYILHPKMFIDGDQWCALYGENIQDGVCGFGDTPCEAARQFDINWNNQKAKTK